MSDVTHCYFATLSRKYLFECNGILTSKGMQNNAEKGEADIPVDKCTDELLKARKTYSVQVIPVKIRMDWKGVSCVVNTPARKLDSIQNTEICTQSDFCTGFRL